MSLPRQILPGEFYMITRSCTQRMFLMRPDADMNRIFEYCLAVAAAEYQVLVILSCVLSNHHHTIVFDPHGRISEFCEYLHKLVAKATNALRGRRENMWSSEALSLVRLVDADDVVAKLVYAATNPVKDGLVASVDEWPGVNTLGALLNDQTIEVQRPKFFFATKGAMPVSATLKMVVPAELGDADEVRRKLREQCAQVETECREDRRRRGVTVLGVSAILEQSWCDQPSTERDERKVRPTIAAKSLVSRLAALARYRTFVDAYRLARERWRAGESVLFPAGTYWLRRFAFVPIATT